MKKITLTAMLLANCILLFAQVQQQELIEQEATKSSCNQTLKGEVKDKITNTILSNTIITLTDENGSPVETQMTTSEGTFLFKTKCDKKYTLKGQKETYTTESKTFTASSKAGEIVKTIIFLYKGNIDFITSSKAIDNKKETIKSKPIISVIETEQPLLKATIANEAKKEKAVQKVNEVNKLEKQINAVVKTKTPLQPKVNSSNEIVLKPIYFDYESSYLNTKAKSQLSDVVAVLKKNPKIALEIASFTDAKGPSHYNKWLSDRRAKRTIDFIIKKGINIKRISGKGYGDTQVINKCTKDIECTDEQRAINRRTEFKVVNNI